ncbi:MAG: hypothetical protein ACI8Q1_000424 [Parvicella sp.]|jgi:hypothetical protein
MFKDFITTLILSLCMAGNVSFGQTADDKEFIQFVFTNLETREQAVTIDQFIRQQTGVYISRADINSKKYLIIFESDSNIDLALLTNWMDSLGFSFKCPLEGTHGVDPIIDQKTTCDQ